MLINLSNHPSDKWSEEQMNAANRQFGKVLDVKFPNVKPDAGEYEVSQMADLCVNVIAKLIGSERPTMHIMGEMNLTYALVKRFHKQGFRCVASTTQRDTEEEDGKKISVFKFVQFREYER